MATTHPSRFPVLTPAPLSVCCLWRVPFSLVLLSVSVEEWIRTGAVMPLTIAFFALILFVATQDIAVDGWAISLLSKRNVSYASTCQSIGQNIGFFASYTVFLALAQPAFCNKFRSESNQDDLHGFVSLSGYMHFWGVAFLVCTLYLLVMKREEAYVPEPEEDQRIISLYLRMWRILKLKRMCTAEWLVARWSGWRRRWRWVRSSALLTLSLPPRRVFVFLLPPPFVQPFVSWCW